MSNRAYGQYCGFARALEVVGERWALLIVRDLLVGPKRFTDLQKGLPGIPSNVLTARLKEFEEAGVVRRRVLARPARGIVYELTPYGEELEDIVVRIGRWGAKAMGDPRADETITVDSLIMAFRSTFMPEAGRGVHLAFQVQGGPIVLHVRVDDGKIEAAAGPIDDPDLVIEAGPGIKNLFARELTPDDAIAAGLIRVVEGDPALLELLVKLFRIEPYPSLASVRA